MRVSNLTVFVALEKFRFSFDGCAGLGRIAFDKLTSSGVFVYRFRQVVLRGHSSAVCCFGKYRRRGQHNTRDVFGNLLERCANIGVGRALAFRPPFFRVSEEIQDKQLRFLRGRAKHALERRFIFAAILKAGLFADLNELSI